MAIEHGIKVTEVIGGRRNLAPVASAIIGVVVTAPAADAAAFPLDRPVLVSNIAAAVGLAGATGTMRSVLRAINDQAQARVVVVRVAPGADAAATTANVIGGDANGVKSGMQALLAAEAQLGVRPRILGAPGLDTQAVTAALVVVAQKLRGFVYASALGANIAAAVTYRGQFAARELMLLYPDFVAFDTVAGANAPSWAAARALGLRARLDEEIGWHKTLSNYGVEGVVGLTKDIQFDLMSTATEAGTLNDAGITALINSDGYRFWGNRTCSAEPLFAFESATRTAQVIADTIGLGLKWAIDKPLRPSLAKDIIETINGQLRQWTAEGRLIGGKAWFDPAVNTTATLSAGKLTIDYDFTPVPPLEALGLNQRITDRYFADFAAGVV